MAQKKLNYEEIAESLLNAYSENEVIPNSVIDVRLNIKELKYRDFNGQEEFIEALKCQQFERLRKIESLRDVLLEKYGKRFINSIGKGYYIPDPKSQIEYSISSSEQKIKKVASKNERFILAAMGHVNDIDVKRKANNKIANLAMIKQLS